MRRGPFMRHARPRTRTSSQRNVFEALSAWWQRAIAISSTSAYTFSPRSSDERLTPARWQADRNGAGLRRVEGRAESSGTHDLRGARIGLTIFRPCGITAQAIRCCWPRSSSHGQEGGPFPRAHAHRCRARCRLAESVCLALERSELSSGKAYNLQATGLAGAMADAW